MRCDDDDDQQKVVWLSGGGDTGLGSKGQDFVDIDSKSGSLYWARQLYSVAVGVPRGNCSLNFYWQSRSTKNTKQQQQQQQQEQQQ